MKSLETIWEELNAIGKGSDKNSVHSYLKVYEKLLAPYRETAKNILEIGLFQGYSMLMWERYFTGKVYGIDCSETPHGGLADLRPMIEEGTHRIHIMNAEDEEEVKERFTGLEFDVVIEDCNHSLVQQVNLYNIWSKYLASGGLYIIEDCESLENAVELARSIEDENDVEIIDNRHVKNRFDDILLIIRTNENYNKHRNVW